METFQTVLASLLGAGGVAFLIARWIATRTVEHGFSLHLQTHRAQLDEALVRTKAALDADVAAAQAGLQASLHRSTELMLGEEAAERSYRFEARKRLYSAVGPLRFQLIEASIRFRKRMRSFGRTTYDTQLEGYFGRSLLYRVSGVLALTELIERQIAHADFSVDPAMIVLLRFRAQVLRALSSGDVPLDHGAVDWDRQHEHVFRDQLPVVAISMVHANDQPERIVRFDEFVHLLDQGNGRYLQPLAGLIDRLNPTGTPIVWLRLLAMAEACGGFLDQEPVAQQLDNPVLDLRCLVEMSNDPHVQENREAYLAMLASFRAAVPPVAASPVTTLAPSSS